MSEQTVRYRVYERLTPDHLWQFSTERDTEQEAARFIEVQLGSPSTTSRYEYKVVKVPEVVKVPVESESRLNDLTETELMILKQALSGVKLELLIKTVVLERMVTPRLTAVMAPTAAALRLAVNAIRELQVEIGIMEHDLGHVIGEDGEDGP